MQTQIVRGYPAPDQRRVLGASQDAPDEGLTQEPATRRSVSAGDRHVAAQPSVRTGAGHTRKGDLSEHHPNRAAGGQAVNSDDGTARELAGKRAMGGPRR